MRGRSFIFLGIFAAISCDHDITTPSIQQSGSFTVEGASEPGMFSASRHFLVLVKHNSNGQYVVERRTFSGDVEWSYSAPAGERSGAAAIDDDDNIYVPITSGVTSLSPTGTVRWRADLPFTGPVALGSDGRVYAATSANSNNSAKYYALNAQTGGIVWSISSTASAGAILVAQQSGIVYFISKGGATAINSSTGAVQWTFFTNGFQFGGGALARDGTLIVAENQDMLRRINAISPAGALKWSYGLAPSPGGLDPLVDADGNIYVSPETSTSLSAGRGFVSLTPTGTVRWSYDLLQNVSGGVIDANKTIYLSARPGVGQEVSLVTIRDGQIVSVDPGGAAPFLDPFGRLLYWKGSSQVVYFATAGYDPKAWVEEGRGPQRASRLDP
jgi:outer membrane protein assembly factor BamB